MSGALGGRTAIVTGAASGIGLGITTRLIADGAAVFAAARSKEDLERVYEQAAIAGGFAGELHRPGVADDLVATAVETLGHVDVLVNNAGGGVIRPTLEHTEETLRATVDNNLWTTIYCVRAVLPHMVSRGHGRIVNIGADSVRTGLVDHAMYNAAKGGVHAMVTGLAREFAAAGITANTVAPCYVVHRNGQLLESGQAPHVWCTSSRRQRPSSRLDGRAIRLRSRQPSPSLPARTADSSPGKRFTSTAAAAWGDGPFPTTRKDQNEKPPVWGTSRRPVRRYRRCRAKPVRSERTLAMTARPPTSPPTRHAISPLGTSVTWPPP